jgi:hypothetical protein
MRTTVRLLAPLALLLWPGLLNAQLAGLDIHAGVAQFSAPLFQVSDGTEFGNDGGLGLRAGLAVRLHRYVEVTAGYSLQRFSCADRCTLNGSGLDVGGRGVLSLTDRLGVWGGGGVLLHRLELRDQPPVQEALWWSIHRTDNGRFFEAGGSFRVVSNLELQAGVRGQGYDIRTRPVDQDGFPGDEELYAIRYTTFSAGLRLVP